MVALRQDDGHGANIAIALGVFAAVLAAVLAAVFVAAGCACGGKGDDVVTPKRPYQAIDTPRRSAAPADAVSLPSPFAARVPSPLPSPVHPLLDDDELKAMRIPFEELSFGALLCCGNTSEVFEGTYQGERVIIRHLLPHLAREDNHLKAFVTEAKVCIGLCHPHIVPLIGISWTKLETLHVVTEYMSGGTVRTMLDEYQVRGVPVGFENVEKLTIARDIASALQYLHFSRVIHRDLKARNVLLDHQAQAKLSDFGRAREWTEDTMTACPGAFRWTAPEVLMGGRYNDSADMYSFGAVLLELDRYIVPHSNADRAPNGKKLPEFMMINRLLQGELAIEFSSCSSADPDIAAVYDLANKCVSIDPKNRPTTTEAMEVLECAIRAL